MKLILAVVSNDDSSSVSNSLIKGGFQITKLASTGGFLKTGNTTILIGLDDDKVDDAIEIIKKESRKRTEIIPSGSSYEFGRYATYPVNVPVGGATVFVIDVDKCLKF